MIAVCRQAGREYPSKKSVDQVAGRCTGSLETLSIVVFDFHYLGKGARESEAVLVCCDNRNGFVCYALDCLGEGGGSLIKVCRRVDWAVWVQGEV